MTSRTSERMASRTACGPAPTSRLARGPPKKSTGTPTQETTRATASTRAAPGATAGIRVAGHGALAPADRLDESLDAGQPRVLENLAEKLERPRRQRVGGVDARHVLDACVTESRRTRHGRDEPVVELECGSRKPSAVQRQVRALLGARRPREVGEGLGAREDAVAVREGRSQRAEVRGVRLDRDDAAGPVVRGEDESRSAKWFSAFSRRAPYRKAAPARGSPRVRRCGHPLSRSRPAS
jgi:hypothetical protein